MSDNIKARSIYLGLIVAIAAISFASIFIKQLEQVYQVPMLVVAFYRMLFATLILLPATLYRRAREIFKFGSKQLWPILLSGLCLAVHFGAWTLSLKYTSISRSVLIVDSQPIFTVLASYIFLRERLPLPAICGVLLAIAGIFLIFFDGLIVAQGMLKGDILALVGAISVVGYVLIGRKMRASLDLLTYVTPLYAVCTLFLLIAVIISGDRLTRYGWDEYKLFIALAVVPTIFGHTVFNWALKHVKAAVVSVSFLGEPIGASLLAFLLLGQKPTIATLVGGAMIMAGIYLTTSAKGE